METLIKVRVQPGARRDEIVGFQGDVLRLRVKAPPREGRANLAVAGLLAKKLDVARSQVRILRGHAAREKVIAVEGIEPARARVLLGG